MEKGGRKHYQNVPKGGFWFSHEKLQSANYASYNSTANNMLESGLQDKQNKITLPSFNKRLQDTRNQGYPFSSHDNRNTVQNFAEYFESNLGRHKTSYDKSQHVTTFNVLDGKKTEEQNLLSIYQHTYTDQKPEHCVSSHEAHRRYPKHHRLSSRMPVLPRTQTSAWAREGEKVSKEPMNILAQSQVPRANYNPWRYSYFLRSQSICNQPAKAS